VLPPDFPLAVAALIEPLAVCVRAMNRFRIENRRSAVVFGDGAIGLLMLLLLKNEGLAHVTLIGGREARLNLARQFGATTVLNYHETADLPKAIAASPGSPFFNVIEASGSPAAMHATLEVAAITGKILVIGDYCEGRADFPWNRILHHELELIGSNASAGGWNRAVKLAISGSLPLGQLISWRVPASCGVEGIALAQRSRSMVKMVLEWPV
jgi:(R,R)-butanediol dehydrogenase/meso-butanediol dehydrogenase/diacetyl reductase